MDVKNWKQRAQERKQWKEIIEQAKLIRSCRSEEEVRMIGKGRW
jgi:hypothetical protein